MHTTTIVEEIRFEAAHLLPNVPEDHKCRRLHGHSYRVEIHVRGSIDPKYGWVMDFDDMAAAFKPVFETLDHHYLNDIPGLENPTSENLAHYIGQRLSAHLPGLSAIVVHETCTSRCVYTLA